MIKIIAVLLQSSLRQHATERPHTWNSADSDAVHQPDWRAQLAEWKVMKQIGPSACVVAAASIGKRDAGALKAGKQLSRRL